MLAAVELSGKDSGGVRCPRTDADRAGRDSGERITVLIGGPFVLAAAGEEGGVSNDAHGHTASMITGLQHDVRNDDTKATMKC